MTLVPCPECSNSVSTSAFQCPQCGHPLNRGRRGVRMVLVLAAVMVGSLLLIRLLNALLRG